MSAFGMQKSPQLNRHGELQHLLTIEGLPRDVLLRILDNAAPFSEVAEREVKKVPLLRGKSVFNLFFENSTRTRTTFEIAAKRLSADVINLNINTSSANKGETLLDTADNLAAMQADMFVVRHARQPVRRPPCFQWRALPDCRAPATHRSRRRTCRQCR